MGYTVTLARSRDVSQAGGSHHKPPLGHSRWMLPESHSAMWGMLSPIPWEMKANSARNQMGKTQVVWRMEILSSALWSDFLPRDEPSGREGSWTAKGTVWRDGSHSKFLWLGLDLEVFLCALPGCPKWVPKCHQTQGQRLSTSSVASMSHHCAQRRACTG